MHLRACYIFACVVVGAVGVYSTEMIETEEASLIVSDSTILSIQHILDGTTPCGTRQTLYLSLAVDDQSFLNLSISRSDVCDTVKVTEYGSTSGKTVSNKKTQATFTGTAINVPGSLVFANFRRGFGCEIITEDGRAFVVEMADPEGLSEALSEDSLEVADVLQELLEEEYTISRVLTKPGILDGKHDDSNLTSTSASVSSNVNIETAGVTELSIRTLKVCPVADPEFIRNSDIEPDEFIRDLVSRAQTLMTLDLTIHHITLITDWNELGYSSTERDDAATVLDALDDFVVAHRDDFLECDIISMFVGYGFAKDYLGLAWVDHICSSDPEKKTSVVTGANLDFPPLIAAVFAHEMFHTMGIKHDGPQDGNTCAENGFVMEARVTADTLPSTISNCTRDALSKIKCLSDNNGSGMSKTVKIIIIVAASVVGVGVVFALIVIMRNKCADDA